MVEDPAFAQRCVHEALRIRPTNPGILRRARVDTEVAGRAVRKGVVCVLDTISANTDPAAYGPDAALFNPNREVSDGIPPYGVSFGAGMHFCIGRTLAVGLPQRRGTPPSDSHLYGMVPIALRAVFERGVSPHPDRPPVPDTKTKRWTRLAQLPGGVQRSWIGLQTFGSTQPSPQAVLAGPCQVMFAFRFTPESR